IFFLPLILVFLFIFQVVFSYLPQAIVSCEMGGVTILFLSWKCIKRYLWVTLGATVIFLLLTIGIEVYLKELLIIPVFTRRFIQTVSILYFAWVF
ncbi:MAG: hypothetical protein ACFFC7_02490, partial [Candidatus Hermodarchaeota archaeon]